MYHTGIYRKYDKNKKFISEVYLTNGKKQGIYKEYSYIPQMHIDYVYLDYEERRRFAQIGHEYLLEQIINEENSDPNYDNLQDDHLQDDHLQDDQTRYLYKTYNYIDDIRNGEYKEYYENGKIKCEGYYLNNKLHGEYKKYNMNGDLYTIILFDNGNKL